MQQVEKTRQQCKAPDIRAAAEEFALNPKGPNPKKIVLMPLFVGLENSLTATVEATNVVFFTVGGPIHHGIFVIFFDTEFSQKFVKEFRGTVIPWDEGVYFLD